MLPDVGSTIVPPGLQQAVALGRVDHRDRDAVLHAAARDCTVSTLASSVHCRPSASLSRRRRTSGVLPTRSRIESANVHRLGAYRRARSAAPLDGTPQPRLPRTPPAPRRGRRRRRARPSRPRAELPRGRDLGDVAIVQHRRGLHARAGRDVLALRRGRRPGGRTRSASDASVRRRARAAADEHDVARRRDAGRGRARRGRRAGRTRRPRPRRARAARGSTSVRSPAIVPDASGRFGVRSPSKYGTSDDAAGAGRRVERERVEAGRGRRRASRAIASVTFVAFSVHTSGRKRPVASAKPATAPGRVGGRRVAHRVHGARRAERDRDVARSQRRRRARRPCCRRCPAPTIASRPRAMRDPAALRRLQHHREPGAQSTDSPWPTRTSSASSSPGRSLPHSGSGRSRHAEAAGESASDAHRCRYRQRSGLAHLPHLNGLLYGHILSELEEVVVKPDETDDLLRLGLHRLPHGSSRSSAASPANLLPTTEPWNWTSPSTSSSPAWTVIWSRPATSQGPD